MEHQKATCPNCTAIITNTQNCEFCGTSVQKSEPIKQMNKTELLNISHQLCPNCGVSISVESEKNSAVCMYCNTKFEILRPLNIALNLAAKSILSADNREKYENYITILQRSMLAENYAEAFNYCNKALEINPNVPELWVNKAICAYFESTKGDILSMKAKETVTYLRTAENYDENNEVLKSTRSAIASNLFAYLKSWANRIYPDVYDEKSKTYSYSWEQVDEIYDLIMLYEVVYEISDKDTSYLKAAINEFVLSKTYNIGWLNNQHVIHRYPNVERDVNRFAEMIKKTEPNYVLPFVPMTEEKMNIPWGWIGSVAGVILFIIFLFVEC